MWHSSLSGTPVYELEGIMATALELTRKGWQHYLESARRRSKPPGPSPSVRQERERLLSIVRDKAVDRTLRAWPRAKTSPEAQDVYLDAVALNLHGFYSGLERISCGPMSI